MQPTEFFNDTKLYEEQHINREYDEYDEQNLGGYDCYGYAPTDVNDYWEDVKYFLMVTTFFFLVFLLPMIPLLMFILTETKPSINQSVFDHLYNGTGGTGKHVPNDTTQQQQHQ